MEILPLSKRQSAILRVVNARSACAIVDLAVKFSVSEETIRRDTKPMAEHGLITKTHGRVSLPKERNEPPLHRRMAKNAEGKQRIGEAAAELVPDNGSVILDPGSTTNYVARALCGRTQLTVVTNSTEIARVFVHNKGISVYLAGGELHHEDAAAFGPTTLEFLKPFASDCVILSVGGIDAERGLMDFDLKHVEYSQFVMNLSQTIIIVADRAKFGVCALASVCDFTRIDFLVTDAPLIHPFDKLFSEAGVRVIVAE